MASMQNAPNVPAALPADFSKEQAQEAFKKFTELKKQGGSENDPEYIKAHQVMLAIQKQAAYVKQRQAHTEAQQRIHQEQQQSLAATNGVNGYTSQGLEGAAIAPRPSSSAPSTVTETPAAGGATDASGQRQALKPVGFSLQQTNLLKTQIAAFQCLSKNIPLTTELQQLLFKSHQSKQQHKAAEVIDSAKETIDRVAAVPATAGPPEDEHVQVRPKSHNPDGTPWAYGKDVRHSYTSTHDPHRYIRTNISYANHGIRKNRTQVTALMPVGVDVYELRNRKDINVKSRIAARSLDLNKLDLFRDPALTSVDDDRIREEKERVAYNLIQARKDELDKVPANVVEWDASKSDTPVCDESLKRKLQIEQKMLRLLPKQRLLRQQIQRDLVNYDNLAQTANRSMYRRVKKQFWHEAKITEKLERRQRDARQNNERKKQADHLVAILDHREEIRKAADTQRARVQKLGRLMLQQHSHIEKEEQKRIERTAKQRLQALKNDDEETYLKLLGQAKDSRISHLLKQTDGFLGQLAASVKEQQQGLSKQLPGDVEELSDSDEDESGGAKVDYYEVAHRVKEEIKVQPNMLVGGTLKEYQVKGLQWMISLYNNNLNGILADEMGLGKTIQTISLLTYLIEHKNQRGPFLVIVPLSTLTNWNLEFEKWAPDVRRIVYKGPPPARKIQQQQLRNSNFQVVLTTYEYIIKDRPVLSRIKWVHMIVDEGHRMKNANSKLSSTLTQYYNTRFRLILTGTPLQNNLPELWALLNFVLPNIFKSVKSFDEWFNTPFANTGGQDKMELTEEEQLLVIRRLHKVLRPFLLRRLKKDVEKDLPDKQERVIKCRFSALQAKIYKQLGTYNKISVSDGKGGKTGIRGLSNMLMQMRKLCNHPFVFEQVEEQMNPGKQNNDMLWRTAGKFELLDRILPKFQKSGHRVLMFFQMTQIMNIMEDFLRLKEMKYLRLDGGTKSDDRSELLSLFNAKDSPYFCFLLSTRAGGLGLNLQTADTVIIFDSDWNPHQDLQAQDRAHRIGQKNEVRILRLIHTNSVEEKILERAQYKLDMDGKVIQAGRFDNKSTNEERDAMLRTLLDSAEAAEELATQEEMDDDDLNLIMARSDEELLQFQELDRERNAREVGKKPRLMTEDELPELYMNEDNPVAEEIEEIAGRGARERTRVKYDDGLTEEQWLMAVDDDEDTLEDAVARKQASINKRNANKEKRAKLDNGAETSDDESIDSTLALSTKKRSRKSAGTKRKADDDVDEEPAPKKKRTKKEKLNPQQRKILQALLESNFKHLDDLEEVVPEESPVPRGLIGPFINLVPRKGFEDYYDIIKNPMCMAMIEKKINGHKYQSLREYREDIHLLCQNARTYNEDGSQLYNDAEVIEAAAVAKLREDTAEKPEFQDFDSSGPNTGNVSSVGTPLANGQNGGTKLKLTFNGNRDDGYVNRTNGREGSDDD